MQKPRQCRGFLRLLVEPLRNGLTSLLFKKEPLLIEAAAFADPYCLLKSKCPHFCRGCSSGASSDERPWAYGWS